MKTLANEGDKQEVLKRLAALRPDSTRRWGKMSCHQMVCHLSDAFLCPMGEKTASSTKPPLPQAVMKWIALYAPMKWPQGIPTRPEMEQGVGGTAPVSFQEDRKKLTAIIKRFTSDQFDWAAHPMFGNMNEKDWMRWGYLHCDHHLRQFGT
jgi:hypothetical protein